MNFEKYSKIREYDPEDLWCYFFFEDILLFYIKENEFLLVYKKGKFEERFYLEFLQEKIGLWVDVFNKGIHFFKIEQNELVAINEKKENPEFIVFFFHTEENLEIYQFLFFHDLSVIHKDLRNIPDGYKNLLWSSIYKNNFLTIISEVGAKEIDFAKVYSKFKFGSYKSMKIFEPYALSSEIQKYHLFGDSPGERFFPMEIIPYYELGLDVLIIKEVTELKVDIQEEFIRRMQKEKGRGIFWIFTSNFDIEKIVDNNGFSKIFWDHIKTNKIILPPLRKSKNDLLIEIQRYLDYLSEVHRKKVRISENAIKKMLSLNWFGNYEELYDVLQIAFFLSKEGIIQESDLLEIQEEKVQKRQFDLRIHTEEKERELILGAFTLTGGNQVHMAKVLGISRGSLQYKIQKYGLKIYE